MPAPKDPTRYIEWCNEISERCRKTFTGRPKSEIEKQKDRESQLGRKHTDESRKKMSDARKLRVTREDTRLKLSMAHIGSIRSIETRQKMKVSATLTKCDIWYGGVKYPDPPKYCELWNENLRNRIRAFFGYQCVECLTPQNGHKLNAHHVHYDKKTCCKKGEEISERSFIALCRSCHQKTNHNRPYWEQHFTDIINNYYGGKCYFTKDEMKSFQQGVTA